ncbi:MAG: hypothetical protein ACOZCO_01125 [Bacteroidota bacterium]
MKRYFILKGIKIALLVAGAVLLFGWLFMLLWNCLVPELFAGPVLTFAQALGLLVLTKILFGGWKGGHWGGRGCRCCCGGGHHGKHHYWKQKMEERMANMSEEEREKLKEKFRKCGWE